MPLTARARALLTPTGVFVALVPIALVLIVHLAHGTTFWFDDWAWIEERRPWTWHVFFEPHNDHLSVVPLAIYKLLFVTVGIGDYLPYRLVVAGLHGLCATLVFVLVGRRAGAWPGVIAGALILFLGSADQDLIWGFQIGFLGSIAGGLGAWLALERRDRPGNVGAGICLLLSIGSSSLGVPIAIGILVEVLLDGGWRQRRLLVAAVPLGLYGAWYAVYGVGKTNYDTVGHALKWAVNAGTAAFGGFAGGGLDRGRVLLAIMILVVVVCVARGWRPSPRAVGVVVTAVVFYALTGFARQLWQTPTTTRYIYLGAVTILLFAAELVRGTRPPAWALAAAGLLAVASAAVNFDWLATQAGQLRAVAGTVRIELAAVELAHRFVPPSYVPPYSFAHAGPYLDAVADLGSSPAVARGDLARLSPDGRGLVDQTLQKVGGISLSPQTEGRIGGVPPRVLAAAGGRVRLTFGCAEVTSSPGRSAAMWIQPAGDRLRVVAAGSPAEIHAARFGDGTTLPSLGTAGARSKVDVVIERDALRTPAWRVRLATRGRALACSLG